MTLQLDTNERSEMQLRLQESLQNLVQRDSVSDTSDLPSVRLGEFLARLSHEVRIPLANMLNYASWLRESAPGRPDVRGVAESLQDCGEHLATLIDDVAEFARIEQGDFAFNCRPTNVSQMLDEIVRLVAPAAEARQIALAIDVAEATPADVMLDCVRVRQVLVNLVVNAIKFTEIGEVRIETDIAADEHTEWLEIRVSDTGQGISQQRMQSIFQPFPPLDDAAQDGRKYGGLGLAVNVRIAQLMGGRIEVESQLGLGSTFTLRLPMMTSEPNRAECGDGSSGAALEHLPPCKLLLVDADQQSHQLLTLMLRTAGAELILARDGRRGFELAMSHRPEFCRRAGDVPHEFDAVLINNGPLAELSVEELIGELRRLEYGQPLIALANHEADAERCLAAGFNDAILRPVDMQSLLDSLRRHLPAAATARG